MNERYFDDFREGDRFETAGKTISEAEILDFALKYDPQPIHMDVEVAREGIYGGLIASGFQTLALGFRLLLQQDVFTSASIGSPGLDELRWLKPVRPGDTIRMLGEVIELRPSRSKPDRGVARLKFSIVNQRGEEVLTAVGMQLLRRRPQP